MLTILLHETLARRAGYARGDPRFAVLLDCQGSARLRQGLRSLARIMNNGRVTQPMTSSLEAIISTIRRR